MFIQPSWAGAGIVGVDEDEDQWRALVPSLQGPSTISPQAAGAGVGAGAGAGAGASPAAGSPFMAIPGADAGAITGSASGLQVHVPSAASVASEAALAALTAPFGAMTTVSCAVSVWCPPRRCTHPT